MMNIIEKIVKWFCGCVFKVQVNGAQNIPQSGDCMICANHISMWDPVILYCFLPRKVRFVAKSEMKKVPVVGWILKKINCIFISRGNVDLAAMRQSLKTLSDGNVLGIFPTGTREKKNINARPKSGCALLAAKSGTKVVPVGINATYKLFSKVVVNIGEPMDFSEYKGQKCSQQLLEQKTFEIYNKILENKSKV